MTIASSEMLRGKRRVGGKATNGTFLTEESDRPLRGLRHSAGGEDRAGGRSAAAAAWGLTDFQRGLKGRPPSAESLGEGRATGAAATPSGHRTRARVPGWWSYRPLWPAAVTSARPQDAIPVPESR